MLIFLYNLLWTFLTPIIPFWIYLRSLYGLEERGRVLERFGFSNYKRPNKKLIWIHAASIGEAVSGLALVEGFKEVNFEGTILFTTGTISSYNQLKNYPEIIHQYHPLDKKAWVNRFLKNWKPNLAIMMESDIWPNLILCTSKRSIPVILASSQISLKSISRWNKIGQRSTNLIFKHISLVLAVDELQAKTFKKLGARNVEVFGSLKVSSPPKKPNSDLVKKIQTASNSRKIILAASTHKKEEEIIIKSIGILRKKNIHCLLIIAPRHISRGQEINNHYKLNSKMRSKNELPNNKDNIWIADSYGEMASLFESCDIAFIAGSLIPKGGHNPSEPCYFNCGICKKSYRYRCLLKQHIKGHFQSNMITKNVLNSFITNGILNYT